MKAEKPPICGDLIEALRHFAEGPPSTHYSECYLNHPRCAMSFAADILESHQRDPQLAPTKEQDASH